MKIYYHSFFLQPRKKHHHQSSLKAQQGLFLKGVLGKKTYFAEYFPHLSLGDKEVDIFLEEFKFQKNEYDQKVFYFLLEDFELQTKIRDIKYQSNHPWTQNFLNHHLMTHQDLSQLSPTVKVVKYKIHTPQDLNFIPLLKKGIRVRLDANAIFDRASYLKFCEQIPSSFHHLIDYVEDPFTDNDWSDLPLKSARDFIEGHPADFFIYKPNCKFFPQTKVPIIFSSYLGHHLGKWHAFSEMIQKADLSFPHGIHPSGFYEEEFSFFEEKDEHVLRLKPLLVQKMYQQLTNLSWKYLCPI